MKILSLLFSIPSLAVGQSLVVPVLNELIADQEVLAGNVPTEINLGSHFGVEEIRDDAVRFTAEWLFLDGSPGFAEIDFLLFRDRTPITVTNFLGYVNRGDYTNMVVHRLVPNFVIQGGGFIFENDEEGAPFVSDVETLDPIMNEFGVSNTLGTISMAKLGGDPDSATSQWFISTAANSDNLDFQNGGFTVFGRVSQGSFARAIELNNQEDFALFNLGGALGQIPLIQNTTNDTFVAERFYRFSSVVEVPVPTGQAGSVTDLTYSVVSPSGGTNPVAVFDGETLSMSAPSATTGGRSIMVVQAEDSVGNQVQDTFSVLVSANYESWRRAVFSPDEVALDAISGPDADPNGDGVTNFVLFVQGLPTDIDARGLVRLPRLSLSETNNELEIDTPFITGVNFEVEESDDLLDWDLVSAVESVTDGLSGRTIQFTLPQGFPTSFKAFYRIRYTLESTNP